MIGKRSPLFVVALLCGVLVAGCGSSSSSTTSGSTTSGSTSTSAPASTSKSTSTTPNAATAAGVAQYVAACKSVIQHEPTLSADVKSKVEGICNKAADGDLEGARKAAKEVCIEVINASPIPAAAKAQAVAACKTD
jgi:ABC-type phosphate transport system substrate-binding protein